MVRGSGIAAHNAAAPSASSSPTKPPFGPFRCPLPQRSVNWLSHQFLALLQRQRCVLMPAFVSSVWREWHHLKHGFESKGVVGSGGQNVVAKLYSLMPLFCLEHLNNNPASSHISKEFTFLLSPSRHVPPKVNCVICRLASVLRSTTHAFFIQEKEAIISPVIYVVGMSILIASLGAKEFDETKSDLKK